MQHITEMLSTWIKNNPFTNKFYGIKSRNEGSFLAFNHDWFEKYQVFLLIALNMPIIGLFVRYIFRLPCSFVESKEKLILTYTVTNPFIKKYEFYISYLSFAYLMPIVRITPTNATYCVGLYRYRLVAYTHVKFSKRVYFSLRWFWWLLHYIDEALNYFSIPEQVSFGFATLTARPDAGSGGSNTTCDGRIYRGGSSQSFSSIISNAGSVYNDTGTTADSPYLGASSTTNKFVYNMRYFATFNTNIGSSANITSKVLSLYIYQKGTDLGNFNAIIVPASLNNTNSLATADYNHFSRNNCGSKSVSTITTSAFNDITIDESTSTIINKTGITQLAVISSWDFNQSFTGTWSSGKDSWIGIVTADATGDSNDPYIYIEYSTSSIKSHIGTAAASVKSHIGTASADVKKHIGLS